jgi:hypothetical protein
MPVSWRFVDGIVFLESDESWTLDEWRGAVDAFLADPAWVPGMGLIHDRRRMTRSPNTQEVRDAVGFVGLRQHALGRARWALVVGSPAGYGMARVGEALLDGTTITLRTFYDMSSAETWVRSGPRNAED